MEGTLVLQNVHEFLIRIDAGEELGDFGGLGGVCGILAGLEDADLGAAVGGAAAVFEPAFGVEGQAAGGAFGRGFGCGDCGVADAAGLWLLLLSGRARRS